jgi:hypothetical protein
MRQLKCGRRVEIALKSQHCYRFPYTYGLVFWFLMTCTERCKGYLLEELVSSSDHVLLLL